MTRSTNIVAWPVHQRWKVSDEDQRRRRNNKLHWRKGKSLALKIYDTFDKSAVKNSPGVFVFLRPRYSLRFPRLRLFIIYLFICSEAVLKNVPVERATLLRRSMRKTTSCKKT